MNLRKLVSIGSIFGLSLLFGLALMVMAGTADAQQAPQAELQTSSISAIGSAFHYQGNLNDNGNPANGSYDFKFTLYDAASDGEAIGELDQASVGVQNGLFNVELDFGATAFDGEARFLAVSVRSAAQGDYLDLEPRQPVLAVPMAQVAQVAQVARQANSLAASTGETRVTVADAGTLSITGRDCCASITMTSGDTDSSAILQAFRNGTLFWTRTESPLQLGTNNKGHFVIDAIGNFTFGAVDNNSEVTIRGDLILDPKEGDCCSDIWLNSGTSGSQMLLQTSKSASGIFTWSEHALGLGANQAENLRLRPDGTSLFRGDLDVSGVVNADNQIINAGADLAEPFAFDESVNVESGTVVAIDPHNVGKLRISDSAYDKTVAGIVSGANGISAGIVMQHDDLATDNDALVALSGRVYVKVDAQYGAIQPGDMLTTSDTPGHAMKASNHELAQGAIIGKAMSSLDEGTGMVLILVSLQ